MRMFLAAAVALLPAMASAEPVSPPALQNSLNQCVQQCSSARSFGFCADMCGCMVGEMGRHWDKADFDARALRLQTDPREPGVGAEMGRLASYCSRRAAMK